MAARDIVEAVRELFVWSLNRKSGSWFTARLYELIDAAPDEDRRCLAAAFPNEVQAFLNWENAKDKKKFFKQHGIDPNVQ